MSSNIETFNPDYGSGQTVAPGVASASALIGKGSAGVVLTNLSATVVAYVRLTAGASVATTADYPVLPGQQVSLSKSRDDDYLSYIGSAAGGSLHVMSGRGI